MHTLRLIFSCAALLACAAVSADEVSPRHIPGCSETTTESYKGHVAPGWDVPQLTWFVAASDPQLPRTIDDFGHESINMGASKSRLATVMDDISSFRRSVDGAVPVLINGDITDYGHGSERRPTQELFRRLGPTKGAPLFFPGLGNHDYANNINDCANNGCARDSVCDVLGWTYELQPRFWDHHFNEPEHYGSFGYSIDVGPNATFVQLNDSPTYNVRFSTGIFHKTKFYAISSVRWLEGVLHDARKRNRYVFLSMHRRDQWPGGTSERFKRLIQEYGVQAVFAGHYHGQLGLAGGTQGSFGSVPVFQSGALLNMTYLIVEFRPDLQRYTVYKVERGRKHTNKVKVGDYPLALSPNLPYPDFGDARLIMYEGNNATQETLCHLPIPYPPFNAPGPYGCINDEVRSLRILKAKRGTQIRLFGNWDHQKNQGYAFINVLDDILTPVTVGSFERSYTDPNGKWALQRYNGGHTLDGKVSSFSMLGDQVFGPGTLNLYRDAGQTDLMCSIAVEPNRDVNLWLSGKQCGNDQARAAIWLNARAGQEICLYADYYLQGANTCFRVHKDYPIIGVRSFDYDYRDSVYTMVNEGPVDGEVSSLSIRSIPRDAAPHAAAQEDTSP